MMTVIWVVHRLLAVAILILATLGPGRAVLAVIGLRAREESVVLACVTGLGTGGYLIGLLWLARVMSAPVLVGLVIASASVTSLVLLRSLARCRPRRATLPIGAAMVAYVVYAFAPALYPPWKFDATMYHLVLARDYLAAHGLVVHRGIAFPVLPALDHVLFSAAIALVDDVVPRLLQAGFTVLTAALLVVWGKRCGAARVGWLAAAVWLSHPLVVWNGTSAYVDAALVSMSTASLFAVWVALRQSDQRWWLLATVLAAFAAGVKIPGLFCLGPVGLAAVVGVRAGWLAPRRLGAGCALAMLLLLPWYGVIAVETGSPIWPGLPALQKPEWRTDAVEEWNQSMPGFDLRGAVTSLVRLPWIGWRQPELLEAEQGLAFVLLAWPIAWLIALRDRDTRFWVVWSIAWTLFVMSSRAHLRYLLPALPIMGLALSQALDVILRTIRRRPVHALWWQIGAIAVLASAVPEASRQLRRLGPLPTTAAQRQRFLRRFVTGVGGVEFINSRPAITGAGTVSLGANNLAYFNRRGIVELLTPLNSERLDRYWRSQGESHTLQVDAGWTAWLDEAGIDWFLIRFSTPGRWFEVPISHPFLERFRLVHADRRCWVFERRPGPPGQHRTALLSGWVGCRPLRAGRDLVLRSRWRTRDVGDADGLVIRIRARADAPATPLHVAVRGRGNWDVHLSVEETEQTFHAYVPVWFPLRGERLRWRLSTTSETGLEVCDGELLRHGLVARGDVRSSQVDRSVGAGAEPRELGTSAE